MSRPRHLREWLSGVVLQFASAASTVIVLVAIARSTGAADFARWAVLAVGFQVFQGMSRATTGVVLGQGATAVVRSRKLSVGRLHGTETVLLAVVLVTTLAFSQPDDGVAVALYVGAAIVALQLEYFRALAIARRMPQRAASIDLIATGSYVAAYLVANLGDPVSTRTATGLWLATSAGAVLLAVARLGVGSPGPGVRGQSTGQSEISFLFVDWFGSALRFMLPTYLLAFVLSATELAGYRGSWLLIGLGQRFARGILEVLLTQLVREQDRTTRARLAGRATRLLVVMLGLLAIGAALLPDSIGTTLLGATWQETRPALAWLAFALAIRGPEVVLAVVMLADRRNARLAMNRVVVGVGELVVVAALATNWGLAGAVVGHLIGAAVGTATLIVANATMASARREDFADS